MPGIIQKKIKEAKTVSSDNFKLVVTKNPKIINVHTGLVIKDKSLAICRILILLLLNTFVLLIHIVNVRYIINSIS